MHGYSFLGHDPVEVAQDDGGDPLRPFEAVLHERVAPVDGLDSPFVGGWATKISSASGWKARTVVTRPWGCTPRTLCGSPWVPATSRRTSSAGLRVASGGVLMTSPPAGTRVAPTPSGDGGQAHSPPRTPPSESRRHGAGSGPRRRRAEAACRRCARRTSTKKRRSWPPTSCARGRRGGRRPDRPARSAR